ncbi:MAG: hypothetical protein IT438_09960 [Phycisphaerales bacterium]|nr:hypothetical protein [Phycisphaerales bacterium]
MGNNIPSKKLDQIVWFENHYPLWETTPTNFGVTTAIVSSVKAATIAARTAYNNAQTAKLAAKNATTASDEGAGAMLDVGRDCVNMIKAFIQNSNNAALWGQAGIEPPMPPGTAPAPTAPYELTAGLDGEGNVLVKWRTSQPAGVSGVIYFVRRSIDGGPFTLIDSVGEKEMVDEGILYGTQTATYIVQAKRGRQTSAPSEALTIRFGRAGGGGGGGMFIQSIQTGPGDGDGGVKMAA